VWRFTRTYLCLYVIRPLVRSYGESSTDTRSPFITLIRLRRSRPAIVASTVFPTSSSIENIPALNFSITLPVTSIASSFGRVFLSERMRGRPGAALYCARTWPRSGLPTVLPRTAAAATRTAAARSTVRLRPSFVDVQCSAVQISAVETVDCCVPFLIDAHFDKGEASRLPAVTVRHDVDAIYRTV
jgi:hypothetical protein